MATTSTIGGSGTLFVGEDKTFRLEVLDLAGVPVDMSGWSLLLDVRKTDKSTTAIFSKVGTVVGTYDAVRATNTQRAIAVLSDTEMNTVKEKTYRYSWKRMDDTFETVLARGDFSPEKATAP